MDKVKLEHIGAVHIHPTAGRCWTGTLDRTATISPDGSMTIEVEGARYLLWHTRHGEVVVYLRGARPDADARPATLQQCRTGGYIAIDARERAAVDAFLISAAGA